MGLDPNKKPAPDKKIAVFDFDDTLIHGDSLPAYLIELSGYFRVFAAFARALGAVCAGGKGDSPDLRTAVKRDWLRRLLAGIPESASDAAAERVYRKVRWRRTMVERLLWHKSQGHEVLVATGALECYIHALLRDLPVDTVLATAVESIDGRLTGALAGVNSVRGAKAERLAAWFRERGPYVESWGYGNAPHDLPMLALCTHKTIV